MLELGDNIRFVDKRKGFWWARNDATRFLMKNAAPGKLFQILGFYSWICIQCNVKSESSSTTFSLNKVATDLGYGRNTIKEMLWALHCLGLITWDTVEAPRHIGGRLTDVETLEYDPEVSLSRLKSMEEGWSDPDQPSDQPLVCTRPAYISNKSSSKNPTSSTPQEPKDPGSRRRGSVELPPQVSPQELQGAQASYYPKFDPRHPGFINLSATKVHDLKQEWESKNGKYEPVPEFDVEKFIKEFHG